MKSKVDKKYLNKLKSKLKEKTGKTITKAKPKEIKNAFKDTIGRKQNIKATLYERRRLMRARKK